MKTILKREVISDIFKEFPQLNKMWVKGDLETFYDATFVIEDCVHVGDFTKFIFCHFDFEDSESGPIAFSESFMREESHLDDSYVECRRENYV